LILAQAVGAKGRSARSAEAGRMVVTMGTRRKRKRNYKIKYGEEKEEMKMKAAMRQRATVRY
jgi:hypothetical protein